MLLPRKKKSSEARSKQHSNQPEQNLYQFFNLTCLSHLFTLLVCTGPVSSMQNYFSHYCFYFPLEETGTQNSMMPFTIQLCLNGCQRHCHIKSTQTEAHKPDTLEIRDCYTFLYNRDVLIAKKGAKMAQDEVISMASNHNVLGCVRESSSISP